MFLLEKNYSTSRCFLIILLLSTLVFSQSTIHPNYESRVDSIFAIYSQTNSPGAAVIVAKDGEILYQKCFGFANIQHHVPVTIQTKFRIGSITKQFTATAIFKLQEQGLLSLSDPLLKYISDYPRGDEISIYNLLTHTSGIPSYHRLSDFFSEIVRDPYAVDEFVK